MERVGIVGPGGAGTSTFARSLGERTGLPVFHLDRFYWKPGWVETPREEWRQRQTELFAADRWIAVRSRRAMTEFLDGLDLS